MNKTAQILLVLFAFALFGGLSFGAGQTYQEKHYKNVCYYTEQHSVTEVHGYCVTNFSIDMFYLGQRTKTIDAGYPIDLGMIIPNEAK